MQLILDLTRAPDTSAGSYIPLSAHKEALAHLQRLQEAHTSNNGFAGLIIQGPASTGKTHILNAWAGVVGADTNDHFVAVDNIDKLDAAGQEALFHTYNRLKQAGGTLLLATTTPLTPETAMLKDLRSRLLTLPVAVLAYPNDADATQLLLKWAHDVQMVLPKPVLNYILTHTERAPAALRQLITDLNTASLGKKQGATLPILKNILS